METNEHDAVRVTLDGPAWLIVETSLDAIEPVAALRWFAEPELLGQWWGDEHVIELVTGGRYEVGWPAMNWTMRGRVLSFTRDQLVYSWTWDHDPNLPARTVIVRGEADGDGTRLTIAQGPYRSWGATLPDEDADCESHRDGWLFFLPKLREATAARV